MMGSNRIIALKDSTAKWKIVVGHHPVRSIGHHGDTKELIRQLLPILEVIHLGQYIFYCILYKKILVIKLNLQENNVDMYINGHDHCLEHISSRSRWVLT